MLDIRKLAETLQDAEIALLSAFGQLRKDRISELKKIPRIAFLRAGMWLENKELVKSERKEEDFVVLDKQGIIYARKTLPERLMLNLLKTGDKQTAELLKKLNQDELKYCIGHLKKAGLISFEENKIRLTELGKKAKPSLIEQFFNRLIKEREVRLAGLKPEEKFAFDELNRRKGLVKVVRRKTIRFSITDLGKKVVKELPKLRKDRIGIITPQIIKSQVWEKRPFRRYDVSANVPHIYPGKKQPYLAFLDEVRAKLVELGFKEMTGPLIETEFWNFDALFQPQNHPAREWTDTYSLKYPKLGSLPAKRLVEAVRKSHESSWLYKWSSEKAKQLVPRAHGTPLSARWLAKGCPDGKYFAIVRCYRPDIPDPTHLTEFNQCEGIVVGDGLNLKNLLGILEQFAIEFAGAKKVRFLPDYYPFTEISVQINAYVPKLGWMEFGGAGIFRPELTKALGYKKPILAWGLGLDRLAMAKLGIKDIRYLFSTDLDWLRKEKVV